MTDRDDRAFDLESLPKRVQISRHLIHREQPKVSAALTGIEAIVRADLCLGGYVRHDGIPGCRIRGEAMLQYNRRVAFPVARNIQLVAIHLDLVSVSYTHLRAHETVLDLVCRLLLEKKKNNTCTQQHTTHL